MGVFDNILREISRSEDTRAHIQDLLLKGDLLDTQTIARIFEAYPEHADLLTILPRGTAESVAAIGLKGYSPKSVSLLIDAGFFETISDTLAQAVQARLSQNEPALIPVIAEYIINGLLNAGHCAKLAQNQVGLIKSLLNKKVSVTILCDYLTGLVDDEPSLFTAIQTIQKSLSPENYLEILKFSMLLFEDSLQSEVCARSINDNYQTAFIQHLLERGVSQNMQIIAKLNASSLLKMMNDPNITENEKTLIISIPDAELVEQVVEAGGVEVEYFRLLSASTWPTENLTISQIEICNHLGSKNSDEKIKTLLIDSIKVGELLLTTSIILSLKNEIYCELMKVIGEIIKQEGVQSHFPSETISAILEAKKHPLPSEFFILVLVFNKDWTKLDPDDQLQLIEYVIRTRPEALTAENNKKKIHIMLKKMSVGFIENGELRLIPSLSNMDPSTMGFLKRIGAFGPLLPLSFLGNYHLRTGKFVPADQSIPIDQINLIIDFDKTILETLRKISGDIILQGLVAKQKGSSGSITFEVELNHHDFLEVLAQSEDVIERAKKLHRKLKKVKKNTIDLLETMSLIDEGADRKFGVELEIASKIPRSELAKKLGRGTTSSDENFSNNKWDTWAVKFDLSVGGEFSGGADKGLLSEEEINNTIIENGGFSAELVSPVLHGRDGIEELKRVLKRLNEIVTTDKVGTLKVGEAIDTGLHVHHSIEDLIKKVGEIESGSEIALAMGNYIMSVQGALYALCSKWRLKYQTARPLKKADELKGDFRYGFTITRYGTLEYRLKEATFNSDAIIRWVVLTQQITMSLIESVNSDVSNAKNRLKEALEGGIDMILAQEFDEDGQKRDLLSHLAYYQAATDFALTAA